MRSLRGVPDDGYVSVHRVERMVNNMSSLSVSPFALESGKKAGCDTDPIAMGFDLLPSATIKDRSPAGAVRSSPAPDMRARQRQRSHYRSALSSPSGEVGPGKVPSSWDPTSRCVQNISLSNPMLIFRRLKTFQNISWKVCRTQCISGGLVSQVSSVFAMYHCSLIASLAPHQQKHPNRKAKQEQQVQRKKNVFRRRRELRRRPSKTSFRSYGLPFFYLWQNNGSLLLLLLYQ